MRLRFPFFYRRQGSGLHQIRKFAGDCSRTSAGHLENGNLKNAAILLFGKRPQKFYPSVAFKIGRFDKDEADLMFQDVIEGNIIQMADRVMEVMS